MRNEITLALGSRRNYGPLPIGLKDEAMTESKSKCRSSRPGCEPATVWPMCVKKDQVLCLAQLNDEQVWWRPHRLP